MDRLNEKAKYMQICGLNQKQFMSMKLILYWRREMI